MGLFLRAADHRRQGSWASRARSRRFALFYALLEQIPPSDHPIHILDVGGSAEFWRALAPLDTERLRVTILNRTQVSVSGFAFQSMAGDATNLQAFADKSVDVVFSNSVIEHVGDGDAHARMAAEVRRVGVRYWVQTPNRYFPIEPHALVPLYQFMPLSVRVTLAERYRVGWYRHMGRDDIPHIAEEVRATHLLSKRELQRLFPEATLITERVCGLAKSFSAVFGWRLEQ